MFGSFRRAAQTPSAALRVVAAALAVVLAAAGCADGPSVDPATGGEPTTGFPRTVRHAFGETTVPAPPQRIVALGLNDLAVAHAVGAPVVGAVGNVTGPANPPYLSPPLPDDVLGLELAGPPNYERIAAYRPDVILAVSSPLVTSRASYDELSRIAPVVVFERELYGSSMADDARMIGRALGREDAVESLIQNADAQIATLRRELPGLVGRTYLFGQARGNVLPMVVGERNLSTGFMRSMGLQVPASLRDAPASAALAPGTVGLSYEQAGLLNDADVLLMTFATPDDRSRFEHNPLIRGVRPVRQGHYQPLTLDQAVVLQAPNVVTVPWLLDGIRPTLAGVAAAPR